MDQDKQILKEWLKKQPHLPQNIHDKMLQRFLQCCDNSIEGAKQIIEKFYVIRSQNPELFDNRDPYDATIVDSLIDTFNFISLPQMTDKRQRIIIYSLLNDDPEKYIFVPGCRASLMFEDVRLLEEDIADEELFIFDMGNFTLRHLTKIVVSTFRGYMDLVQEAFPAKRTQIHLVNAPTFLDRIMLFLRPFLTNDALDIIYNHVPGSDTIYKYISKDYLPKEYGGTAGNCKDIREYWLKRMKENKQYLQDESRWKVNENKRSGSVTNSQLFGTAGSFRRLDID